MSRIDVTAEIQIAAEPTDVAGVMFDPHREPEWVDAVQVVDVLDRGLAPGARVKHSATIAGRPVTWMSQVTAFNFPHMLDLRLSDGPVEGRVVFLIGRADGGSFARVRGTVDVEGAGDRAAEAARDALGADLARLKTLVEAETRR